MQLDASQSLYERANNPKMARCHPPRHTHTHTPVKYGFAYSQRRALFSNNQRAARCEKETHPPKDAPAHAEVTSPILSPPPDPADPRRAPQRCLRRSEKFWGALVGAAPGDARGWGVGVTVINGKSGEVSAPAVTHQLGLGALQELLHGAAGRRDGRQDRRAPPRSPAVPRAARTGARPRPAPPRSAAGGDVRPCRKGRRAAPRRGAEGREGRGPRRADRQLPPALPLSGMSLPAVPRTPADPDKGLVGSVSITRVPDAGRSETRLRVSQQQVEAGGCCGSLRQGFLSFRFYGWQNWTTQSLRASGSEARSISGSPFTMVAQALEGT